MEDKKKTNQQKYEHIRNYKNELSLLSDEKASEVVERSLKMYVSRHINSVFNTGFVLNLKQFYINLKYNFFFFFNLKRICYLILIKLKFRVLPNLLIN